MGQSLSLALPPAAGYAVMQAFANPAVGQFATDNMWTQLGIFAATSCLPGLLTGRMSYVDISWPWGLVAIGARALMQGDGDPLRRRLVGAAFLLAGLRMGLGGLALWRHGHLNKELPRYLFQRRRWAKRGVHEGTLAYTLTMQFEILVQAAANIGTLCFPAAFLAFSNKLSGSSLSPVELLGWGVWLFGMVFESTADSQKMSFVATIAKEAKKCATKEQAQALRRRICNVGLWQYSRHPNYFGQWIVWVGLMIAAAPTAFGGDVLGEDEGGYSAAKKLIISACLLAAPYAMYVCLNTYTGAVPAEYYSLQKRPEYAKYQKTTNMFFPGPRR